NLQDAFAGAQLSLDALFKRGIDSRPTELLALCDRALKASVDTLPDHAALKLGERAADLKHRLACRCRGVDRLLVEVQINATCLQRLDSAKKVNKRPTKPVDCPGHDDVKLASGCILEHLVEAWTPIAALRAADASIVILLDHLPAAPLGDLPQNGDLVLDGLLVGGNPNVNCGALLHDSPRMLSGSYRKPMPKTNVSCIRQQRKMQH